VTPPTPPIAGHPRFGGVFRGVFKAPGYTQFPNELLDSLMPYLSGAEFKVLAYIARRTFGFHRQHARISFEQLCNGLVLPDGRRVDGGTGLSRSTVQGAIDSLEEAGVLIVRRAGNVKGVATYKNTYTIAVEGEDGVAQFGDMADSPALVAIVPPRGVGVGAVEGEGNAPDPLTENRAGGVNPMPNIGPPHTENRAGGDRESVWGEGAYKGKKESGKESRNKAGGLRSERLRQNERDFRLANRKTVKHKCPLCENYGVIKTPAMDTLADAGTLMGVRELVEMHGAQYCICVIGQGWQKLVEDAALGDGPRKPQMKGAQ
jgi:DNA-binding transcriptional ArsR family regulator